MTKAGPTRILASNKNLAIVKEGAKDKSTKARQHRLKIKHRLSRLRRQSSHKMKREPLVSSLEKLRLQEHLLTHSRTSVIMMRATKLLTKMLKKEMTMKQEIEI